MYPVDEMAPMETLDLPSGLANRHVALPGLTQAITLFIQERIGRQHQRPEAHECRGAHDLVLIQPQQLLGRGKGKFE
jgi:hypothetical protein